MGGAPEAYSSRRVCVCVCVCVCVTSNDLLIFILLVIDCLFYMYMCVYMLGQVTVKDLDLAMWVSQITHITAP